VAYFGIASTQFCPSVDVEIEVGSQIDIELSQAKQVTVAISCHAMEATRDFHEHVHERSGCCTRHGKHDCGECSEPPYDVGDTVRILARFRTRLEPSGARVPVDPGTVAIVVLDPLNVETMYTYLTDANVTRILPGFYQALIACTDPGIYHFRFVGSGSNPGVAPGSFRVRTPAF
jgi:hypothetical protein